MGKNFLFPLCESSGAGRQFVGPGRSRLPPWDPWRCLPCCLPALSPGWDVALGPCLHHSSLGMPCEMRTWPGAPSAVAGVGQCGETEAEPVWGEPLPAGLYCLPPCPASNTLTPVSPCGLFFPFQFFRAFSKKAEDGIRITSEYLEPQGFFYPRCKQPSCPHPPCIGTSGSPRWGQLSPWDRIPQD